MILRFQGRDGQFRLSVEPTQDFASILHGVADHLPKDVDMQSITVANKPHGGESRALVELNGVTFQRVGIK